jgi:hypothetical protein
MESFHHRYCKNCHKYTEHIHETYADRTILSKCLECNILEYVRKGSNYGRFEQRVTLSKS